MDLDASERALECAERELVEKDESDLIDAGARLANRAHSNEKKT